MFKIGDKVTPVEAFGFGFKMGDIHTVESVSAVGGYIALENHGVWQASRFKLVEEKQMEQKKTPHKHAELIKAWADGAVIQFFDVDRWEDIVGNHPNWGENEKYRVKPPEPIKKSSWQGHTDYGVTSLFMHKEDTSAPEESLLKFIVERRFEDGLLVDVVVHKV